MDRFLMRRAALAACAAWAAGWVPAAADEPSATQAPAQAPAATDDDTATLDSEVAKAHALRIKGSYDEAGKDFGQLMLVAPDDVRVVGEYGKTLVQQGRPDEALPFLKRALELQANDWSVYSALGVAYDQTDDHTQARAAYEHALSLKPDAPDILNNYAVSRMLTGDYDGARKLFAEASPSSDAKIANNLALLETMKRPAASVAASILPAPHTTASTKPAIGAPRMLAGVVMEKVPTDPMAGPVGHHVSAHKAKLAETHRPAQAMPPMLRTAADGQ